MPELPPVVLEHYCQPRNRGPLEPADGVGRLEGHVEGSERRLYLRIASDGRVEASFEVRGDTSPISALSMLTTWIEGRSLGEVEAVVPESLIEHFGLGEEQLPLFDEACELLRDALAALRGEPSPFVSDGEVVCKCLRVRRGRIERSIARRGLHSVAGVRFWTRASTGCGSCQPEIEGILAEAGRGDGIRR